MGKARIVSGGDAGLYSVEVLVNRERIEAEIAQITARISDLDAELGALESEKAEAESARNLAQFDLNEAIREYTEARDAAITAGDPIPPPPDFSPLIVAVQRAAAEVQKIEAQMAALKARRLTLQKRRQQLESVPEDPVQQAWCADLTENLAGEVATVELPGEGAVGQFLTWRRLIVRPGYAGGSAYSAARDGQLHHRLGMSPEQAFFNAAILPGWQRWKPLHRIGTITAINYGADTCTLNLQSEDSSAQSLLIDPPGNTLTLSGVPIVYMDCNASAFAVGDRVLVELEEQDWEQPKVIGFEKEPKACEFFLAVPFSLDMVADARFFDGSCIDLYDDGPDSYSEFTGRINQFESAGLAEMYLHSDGEGGIQEADYAEELPGWPLVFDFSDPNLNASNYGIELGDQTELRTNAYAGDYWRKPSSFADCENDPSALPAGDVSHIPLDPQNAWKWSADIAADEESATISLSLFAGSSAPNIWYYPSQAESPFPELRMEFGLDLSAPVATVSGEVDLSSFPNITRAGTEREAFRIVKLLPSESIAPFTDLGAGRRIYPRVFWLMVQYRRVPS